MQYEFERTMNHPVNFQKEMKVVKKMKKKISENLRNTVGINKSI